MSQFDIIPFVFELARISKGCMNDQTFYMTYDEYVRYSQMFETLSMDEKRRVIESAKNRKEYNKDWRN